MGAENFKSLVLRMKCIIIMLAALAVATAIPMEENSSMEEAKSTVSMLLQSGKTENACKQLSKATIKEVRDNGVSTQKLMDSTNDGSQCKAKGQANVAQANNAQQKASKKHSDATIAADAACTAKITFAPRSLNSLTEGQCNDFKQDPAYLTAKKKCSDKKSAKNKASGELDEANKVLAAAKVAAEKARKACVVVATAAIKKAGEVADKTNADNKIAWDKAYNIQCVLDGKSNCKIPKMPNVIKPKLKL